MVFLLNWFSRKKKDGSRETTVPQAISNNFDQPRNSFTRAIPERSPLSTNDNEELGPQDTLVNENTASSRISEGHNSKIAIIITDTDLSLPETLAENAATFTAGDSIKGSSQMPESDRPAPLPAQYLHPNLDRPGSPDLSNPFLMKEDSVNALNHHRPHTCVDIIEDPSEDNHSSSATDQMPFIAATDQRSFSVSDGPVSPLAGPGSTTSLDQQSTIKVSGDLTDCTIGTAPPTEQSSATSLAQLSTIGIFEGVSGSSPPIDLTVQSPPFPFSQASTPSISETTHRSPSHSSPQSSPLSLPKIASLTYAERRVIAAQFLSEEVFHDYDFARNVPTPTPTPTPTYPSHRRHLYDFEIRTPSFQQPTSQTIEAQPTAHMDLINSPFQGQSRLFFFMEGPLTAEQQHIVDLEDFVDHILDTVDENSTRNRDLWDVVRLYFGEEWAMFRLDNLRYGALHDLSEPRRDVGARMLRFRRAFYDAESEFTGLA